jgi:antitoxin VapB
MPQHAKLFKSGGSQAVRLPREFRFEGEEEVLISRQGDRVILEPVKRTWNQEFLALAGSAPDFPYPEEPPSAEPGPELDS